ncbi:ClpP/crotonase-like domain-containing protein [Lentinula edodes]|uniref:ClpP/crotonase-like domain-containing protein n=1 Tax=Lentinula edodes TaxID=5353 RepID=UPI001E8ECC01|nr:ClpP/crotonase-like domain-containing protein [Lentinula edodes]KAH7875620.1 ClpP/crotonase-like domain-containing protein [Lentinula edodes]KAJ3908152.1 ClpP/crotonase-like domain-containing protein [Lentinula edodes]
MKKAEADPLAQAYLHKVNSHPGVYCIALNRPKSKNAISVQLLKDLRAALNQAISEKLLNVLIFYSSTPGAFCSGADLIERKSMTDAQVREFLSNIREIFNFIDDLPFPTIAAIDGPALGGGLELALTCDFRIAASDVTKMSFPEVRLGIIPGAGGTQRAPRLIGMSKAKELIFTGRNLTARDAQDLGLVDYVAGSSSTAFERALELAKEMSSSAPLALRAAKSAMSRSLDTPLITALNHERTCYESLLDTKDRLEALVAFREKRRPVFVGE